MRKLLHSLSRGTQLLLLYIVLITAVVFLWPHGPNFPELGYDREEELAVEHDALVVGVSWPIEARGPELVNGIQLAVQHIAEKQIIKLPIQLEIKDDRDQVKRTQDVARDFATNLEMSAVIGFATDNAANAAAAIYEASRLLQVTVGAASTELTRRDHTYMVHTTLSARKLARHLAGQTGGKGQNYAVLIEKSGYWEEFAEEFFLVQSAKGGSRVYKRTYPMELRPDFVRISYEIREAKPDFILLAGEARDAVQLVQQLHRVGIKAPLLCSCTDVETVMEGAGKEAFGMMMPGIYDPKSQSTMNQHFVAAYQKRFGAMPDQWAAQGYDAMLLLANAVAESGTLKPSDIGWSIRYMEPVKGVTGTFDFNPEGELEDKGVFLRVLSAADLDE